MSANRITASAQVETIPMAEQPAPAEAAESQPLGYGNGNISRRGEADLTEARQKVCAEIIGSGECVVKVTAPGDGCIDGRRAKFLRYINKAGKSFTRLVNGRFGLKERRATVAGGGYNTSRPMLAAVKGVGRDARADAAATVQFLHAQGMVCGGHTAERHGATGTGCGACDSFADIIRTADKFVDNPKARDDIEAIFAAATGRQIGQDVFTTAMATFDAMVGKADYLAGLTGADTLKIMQEAGAFDRDRRPAVPLAILTGQHNEKFIYLNFGAGTTFSQEKFAELLRQNPEFKDVPDEALPQVFACDIWRVRELAEAIGHTDAEIDVAFIAGIIYQLATAAALTDGSLEVWTGNYRLAA